MPSLRRKTILGRPSPSSPSHAKSSILRSSVDWFIVLCVLMEDEDEEFVHVVYPLSSELRLLERFMESITRTRPGRRAQFTLALTSR